MKMPIILTLCVIGFVLVGGCTNTTSAINPVTPTQIMEPITQLTVPPSIVQTTVLASNTETICGEMVYCGYAPAGFETQPIKSTRCDQLNTMRMNNDQKVMRCVKNPYEASANNALVILHCNQGIGTVEDCSKYGVILDHDNGNVIQKNYSYSK
jgi:hypothetical protein